MIYTLIHAQTYFAFMPLIEAIKLYVLNLTKYTSLVCENSEEIQSGFCPFVMYTFRVISISIVCKCILLIHYKCAFINHSHFTVLV